MQSPKPALHDEAAGIAQRGHVESALQRLLELLATLCQRTERRSFMVQDLLWVMDAAGGVRSAIHHDAHAAS